MQKIKTFLWFHDDVEQVMKFYTGVFKNSKIVSTLTLTDTGPDRSETVTVGEFILDGVEFTAMTAKSNFQFNESISLYVDVDTQEELDNIWNKLISGGGKEVACGWLRDQYGLSWQIVPRQLMEMIGDKDKAKARRVMEAMMNMVKLDIAALKRAYDGK